MQGVLKSYHKFVKPAFTEFVRPTLKYADIIVPRARPKSESDNQIAIDFIVHNLEHKLIMRGFKLEKTPNELPLSLSLTELHNLSEQATQCCSKLVLSNDTTLTETLTALLDCQVPESVLVDFMLKQLLEQMQKHSCAPWSRTHLQFP